MGEREEGRREGAGGERRGGGGDSGHMAPGGRTGASLPEGKTLYPESEARVLNVFFQLT